jgi:hypothetical protein
LGIDNIMMMIYCANPVEATLTKRKEIAVSRALSIVRKYFPEVTSVEDSEHDIRVEVTKRDEAVATKKSHKTCAMAVACKRKLDLDGVIVSVKTAYMIKGKKAIRFSVPEHVSREVVSFDRGAGFEPGEYKLNKPTTKLGEGSPRGGPQGGHRISRAIHLPTKNIRTVLGSEVE